MAQIGSLIHYESAFIEVKELCKEILATTQATQNLAEIQSQEIASISDELLGLNTSHDIQVKHDPRTYSFEYFTRIGPCQPKLSAYPKNTDLAMKGKQGSFSSVWYEDYPYLEYSTSKDKAYC